MNTLKALEVWLKKNNPTELAVYLGYRSSTTIHQWITRKSIPKHQEDRVKKFIEERKNGNA